ncbi:MAG: uracil-DNA glycosylase [Candidatus Thermoplasmatota archaeon]|nr:uracil-DNA glycosylase [Candidatus Thermoplasmatota archaeon]MBS3789419.1 uracil-DNA glycosylase [Candidatus Thermoplasmatota archaeon]
MEIDQLNSRIRSCSKCRLSETRTNAVCGEGDRDARIMLVAQSPGENEDEEGIMFIGPSGDVLDDLFDNSGMERDKIYMTNLLKCMLPDYRKPKQNEIETCSTYLDEEIEIVDPDILVPLGYYSTRYLFKKYDLSFDATFSDMIGELVLADDKKIYPLAHPASLLYDDSFEEEMKTHYEKLTDLLKPCRWYDICPMKRFYEEGKIERRWVELYCKGDWQSCVRYQKEEKGEYHPDSMLPNGEIKEELESIGDKR